MDQEHPLPTRNRNDAGANDRARVQDAMARRFQRSSVVGAVRFGIPENYLGDRLPPLLARFSRMFPSIRLDVTVDNYLALRDQIDAGALDLAVTLSLEDDTGSGLLRQTRFVWAAAEIFERPEHAPLPGAFAPKPCLHRQIGIGALEDAGLQWRMAFTSPSQQGLRAAVQAGLAVTALPEENLETGMVMVNDRYDLPSLPEASFRLLWSAPGKTPAAVELAQLLADMPVAF
jgi:DNA-binding transcriptional LysR family regulator